MKTLLAVTAALALLCLGSLAQADVFNLGTGYTNLETVAVGDPGNAGELSGAGAGGIGPDRICGSVAYNYNIGKYEVTAKQYTDFLNNKAKCDGDPYGLYNTYMGDPSYYHKGCNIQRSGGDTVANPYIYTVADDWANRPVNMVTYWDACRFANWLSNGQGNGDTETGAYTLTASGIANNTITRNDGWNWAVTSEDEWYKAAYYDPGKAGGAGYWDYPTKSNAAPANQVLGTDPGNSANYYINNFSIGSPYYRTNVGEFENSGSAYGTFDQGGNVWEWNEAVVHSSSRGLRGGSLYSGYDGIALRASSPDYLNAIGWQDNIGFRVCQVPEPSSIITLAGGLVGLSGIRRRSRAVANK